VLNRKFSLSKSRTNHSLNVGNKQKKNENRMTNLLQENKEIERQRTNCTFGFLPARRQTLKNQKSNFHQHTQVEN